MLNYFLKNLNIIITFSVFSILSLTSTAEASGIWDDMDECRKDGTCGVNDFVRILVNLSRWMLGISGSLSLLFFVYGGVLFIVSSGNSDLVARAKRIIIGSLVGLIIVFVSFSIISFIMTSLGYNQTFGQWFATP